MSSAKHRLAKKKVESIEFQKSNNTCIKKRSNNTTRVLSYKYVDKEKIGSRNILSGGDNAVTKLVDFCS